MRNADVYGKLVPGLIVVGCLFLWGCGERPMGPKEEQAIQIIKGHTPEGEMFSIISNIEKRRTNADLEGNQWTMGPWEAGLLSQGDRINDELSQYFNIFEAPAGRWVRFSYTDQTGTHEALWETHLYRKTVVAKNDVAAEFMTSPPE